jgi:broad specificity phosphatase PhoE
LGQVAGRQRRKTDPALTDCGLSAYGAWQAKELPAVLGEEAFDSIELVLSSPLTRALKTACLGFPEKPVTVHHALREVGSMIPENIPRPINRVLKDLRSDPDINEAAVQRIDAVTLLPDSWPARHDTPPRVVRRDRIRGVFAWLAREREERCVAVVCHYHVIRSALSDPHSCQPPDVHPQNASPIKCRLDVETGRLSVAVDEDVDDDTPAAADPMEWSLCR